MLEMYLSIFRLYLLHNAACSIASPIRKFFFHFQLNVKIVPTIELEFDCNSYALDFYKHGNKVALCHDNGLKSGYDFEVIRDFMLVLKCLFVSLSEMSSSDEKLLKAFNKLSKVFEIKFKKAYSSRRGQ